MCGITGAVDLTGSREFSARQLRAMTQSIGHRGPDDEHIHIEPGVALGARRLAIRDIANGRQPISNEAGNIWSSFNGEIFNYPELRQELLARGHQLRSRCDTEIWPHLYEEYNEEMLKIAKGQFAVALWDRTKKTLILGRDRAGISPLYYAERDGWLIWGSEVKALLASGLVTAEPDRKAIDYLFNFSCSPSRRSFFKDIKLLPPGHFITVKDGKVKLARYWDLDFPDQGNERRVINPKILIDELEDHLNTAIKRRLESDVPIVNYISGGLDSTVLLGLRSKLQKESVPSFTIGLNPGAGPDERSHSAESARLLNSNLTTVAFDSSDIAEAFPELITACEGPLLDTSCAAMMLLANAVNKQGYKVALTGEGADEALAGYIWFKTHKISNTLKDWVGPGLPRFMRKIVGMPDTTNRIQIPEHGFNGIRPAQQHMYESLSQARGILYSNQMWDHLNDHDAYTDLDIDNERLKKWHPLNQSLYVGYKLMLPGLLMMAKGDRAAMNSSVETRYPYLDEDVIQFCASIAPDYKLKRMTDKWLLRQVAAKNLPVKIANRAKTMFRAKLFKTFRGPNRPTWVDQLLSPESLRKTGYFNPEAVMREHHLQNTNRWMITPRQYIFDAVLTSVLSTQLWHHLYFGGGLCDLPSKSIS